VADPDPPAPPPTGLPPPPGAVFATPLPPSIPLGPDPYEPARKWVTYALVILLAAIVAISALMLYLTLRCHFGEGAHFVLDWMGIALGPVSALTGSAVTFYMERTRRG
jgi:hypothetical protein